MVTAVTVAAIAGVAATVLATGTGRAAATQAPATSVLAASQPTGPGGTWGPPQPVPGLAALFPSGALSEGGIDGISCAAPGNCSATGTYWTSSQTPFPFVVSEVNGAWGQPMAVPAVASPVPAAGGSGGPISCGAPGDCTATWSYTDANGDTHAYLIGETNGTWATVQAVAPGTVDTAISCPSAGNCVAAGDSILEEANGIWKAPQGIPGVASLGSSAPLRASLTSVSCASAGNCAAGGNYTDASRNFHAFAVTEKDGAWGNAEDIPGLAALSTVSGKSAARSVSCGAPGDCALVGYYPDSSNVYHTFVTDEAADGTWNPARQFGPSSTRSMATSVSCSSAGNCGAIGKYLDAASNTTQSFVVNETNGTWGTPQEVPGLNASESLPGAISCTGTGDCAVTGEYYPAGTGSPVPYTADEVNGTWHGSPLPGTFAGLTSAPALSCAAPGYCGIGGTDDDNAYVGGEATTTATSLTVSSARVTYGNEQALRPALAVSSAAGGTPAGSVSLYEVLSADGMWLKQLCTSSLASGTGSCAIPATSLTPGTYRLEAVYEGDTNYATSISAVMTLTIIEATPRITMTLSNPKLTLGHESAGHVHVIAAAPYSGTPTGRVQFMAGTFSVGWISLDSTGQGTWTPGNTDLSPGNWRLSALYHGDGAFASASSASQVLTVTRAASSTRLTLSRTTVPYGHENSETLTVAGSSGIPGWLPSGRVTIKAGKTALCVITLSVSTGKGSCRLSSTRLRAGSYKLIAFYGGDTNFTPSSSAPKTLRVTG